MAVSTFGNNIVGAFTGGVPVTAIYMGSTKVWPMSEPGPEPDPDYWYLSWTPTTLSGSFSMFSGTEYFEDFSGYYSWSGSESGYIPHGTFHYRPYPSAFNFRTIETNVKSIGIDAFESLRYLSNVSASLCSYIDSYAFRSCSQLTSVYLPKVESIDYGTFSDCSELSYVYAPNVKRLDQFTFGYCTKLESVSFPKCTSIARTFVGCTSLKNVYMPIVSDVHTAFVGCTALISIELPVATYVPSAFVGCTSLEYVSLPACSILGNHIFEECTALSRFESPVVISVEESAFYNCTSLKYVSLPNARYFSRSCFIGCDSLESISLPACQLLENRAFYGCSSLKNVTIGNYSRGLTIKAGAFSDCINLSTLIFLTTCNFGIVDVGTTPRFDQVFTNTPLASGSGSIFVPASLVSFYKASSLWSSLSSMIFPIPS